MYAKCTEPLEELHIIPPNFSWCVKRSTEWILILRMNINAQNILTMQLSSLSVTTDWIHCAPLAHIAKYKAASSVRNWVHCFSRLVRCLVQMVGRERALVDQEKGWVAPSAGARGLNLFDWNVQLRKNAHTHPHTHAHVCHHTAEYVRTVEVWQELMTQQWKSLSVCLLWTL